MTKDVIVENENKLVKLFKHQEKIFVCLTDQV
jgi:hypothetical protein